VSKETLDVSSVEESRRGPVASTGAERRFLVPALIAGLVATLAVALVFFILVLREAETSPEEVRGFLADERPKVENVAAELITLFMNYDATNLEERAEAIRELATGSLREDYEELVEQGLGEALEEAVASSRGQIISGPDVSFRSPFEAVALARATQTTQSKENPQGRTFEYNLKITLLKTADAGWKAEAFEILSELQT
jgi:hypothetical protein